MFDHDVTMELIRRAQQGDEQAKTRLIEENTPLLKSIIRRYVGKGVEYDDLFQISSVGLLKAINNFSLEYNVKFSTYAVPMVLGEVKRFLRASLLQFIKEILKSCYLPIFIFSNSEVEDIKEELQSNEIDIDNVPIFIKSKSDIISDGNVKVMEVISAWKSALFSGTYRPL